MARNLHSLSLHGREEHASHLGNGLLEGHFEAIVESLGAHDAVLASIHNEATKAGVSRVLSVVLRQELCLVNLDFARQLVAALERFDLRKHGALILLNSIADDGLEDADIALAAAQSHLGLNQLDQTLHEQVFEEVGVRVAILRHLLGHPLTSRTQQALHQVVSMFHALNARSVHFLRLGDLRRDLGLLHILQHLILQFLGLIKKLLLREGGELIISLPFNLLDTLSALLLDELDHALHDPLRLTLVHFYLLDSKKATS